MPEARIYRSAQRIIHRHGLKATEHAERMMQHFIENDDPQGAGAWLVIGQAIEDLEILSQPRQRH
jgi:hypothetical protein